MKAQRLVWGETLAELAATDRRIVVLDGDLATSTRADLLADAVPEAFIQVGIAEQNMVGMAFGLTTMGYRPWLSTFGVFLTHRALDPIRMMVSQTKAPVRERLARFVAHHRSVLTAAKQRPSVVDMRYPNGFALRLNASAVATATENKGKP